MWVEDLWTTSLTHPCFPFFPEQKEVFLSRSHNQFSLHTCLRLCRDMSPGGGRVPMWCPCGKTFSDVFFTFALFNASKMQRALVTVFFLVHTATNESRDFFGPFYSFSLRISWKSKNSFVPFEEGFCLGQRLQRQRDSKATSSKMENYTILSKMWVYLFMPHTPQFLTNDNKGTLTQVNRNTKSQWKIVCALLVQTQISTQWIGFHSREYQNIAEIFN